MEREKWMDEWNVGVWGLYHPINFKHVIDENQWRHDTTHQVEIAQKEGAKWLAHGATGKGNDQVIAVYKGTRAWGGRGGSFID